MKHKFQHLVCLSTFIVCLSSCSFSKGYDNKISKLEIIGTKEYFHVGQSYFEHSDLSITGYYKTKSPIDLDITEVSISLYCGENSYDIFAPLSVAGTYSLKATYQGVKSNFLTFTVSQTEKYVESMTVIGPSELGTGGTGIIELSVSPESFTTDISYDQSGENIVSIQKIDDFNYKVKALTTGDTDIIFKAKKNQSEYVEVKHHIHVVAYAKTTIEQTYNDYIKNNYFTLSSCPTNGEPRLLVIPTWFTDSSSYIVESKKETVRSDIEKAYFGTSKDTGWNSVNSYYKTESQNTLDLKGTVSEWYCPDLSVANVCDIDSGSTSYIVKDAVDWYFTNHTDDSRTNYDYDEDGYLDGVMLIYAAPDNQIEKYQSQKQGSNMWAYCYWCQDGSQCDLDNPGANVFFWASYDFMYNSATALKRTGKKYGNGDNSHCALDTHTYIHEMGHVFGLEDYYDYAHDATGRAKTVPAGAFSMQDYNVGGHDAFSMMSLGWANPYIPTQSCTITIEEFQKSHDLVLLTPSWNEYNSAYDEYLLLELYSPNGLNEFDTKYQYNNSYPQGPNSVGIRLFHVSAKLIANNNFTTDVSDGNVLTAFNNTSDSSVRKCNAGIAYQKYSLLHLIRNNETATLDSTNYLSNTDLFKVGNSFDMSTFSKQFVRGSKLDFNNELGWSFTVNSIQKVDGTYSAQISLVKA